MFTLTAKLLKSCYQLNDVMSKSSKRKFEIASTDAPLMKKVVQINWETCFICHSEKNNCLIVSPFKSPQYDSDPKMSSYYRVAESFRKFYRYRELPLTVLQIHIENCKTDQDLVSRFVKQKAVFHKTRLNKYDSYKFKQKVETKSINTSSSSPVETPCSTKRILSRPNYSDNCFFAIKQMMQLISIIVKLNHWVNVLEKWHKS